MRIYKFILLFAVFVAFYPPSNLYAYSGIVSISSTGSGCALVGVWNTNSKTCTLTDDVLGRVNITGNGVVLDGNGHMITRASSGDIGINVSSVTGIVIKNLNIKNFGNAIVFNFVSGSTIQDVNIISAGGNGLFMKGGQNNKFLDSTIVGGYRGIFTDSGGHEISRNIFKNLANSGVVLSFQNAKNITIENNTFEANNYGIYAEHIRDNIIRKNTFKNNIGPGYYEFNNIVHNTLIVNNNFIDNGLVYNEGQTSYQVYGNLWQDLPIGGNYWSDFDESDEGCNDANNNKICDVARSFGVLNQDILPWKTKDGWVEVSIPEEYFAKVKNSTNGVAKLYSEADSGLEEKIIKTLPNDWVLKVFSKTLTPLGWIKVEDPTDNSTGWVLGGFDILPYDTEKQIEYENISTNLLNTKAERATKIVDIVNHYYNNTDILPSLYSSDDNTTKISILKNKGFPVELILAIIAQESGGSFGYNNELVSYDYGHGITQVTFHAWANEPSKFIKNAWDNRSQFSKNYIALCKSYDPSLPKGLRGLNNYFDCYKDAGTKNRLPKPYKNYKNDLTNPVYKQYTNTIQSMYANIKDGIGDLSRKYSSKCPKANIIIQGVEFTCNDIEKVLIVWGYNGKTIDPAKNYMRAISKSLSEISTHFPGITYNNTDNMIEKLRIANDNRVTIRAFSPVNIQVTGSSGAKLGVFNEDIFEDIPNSIYSEDYESATILFPEEELSYKIVGTEEGEYGLVIESLQEGEEAIFSANGLPVKKGEVHIYTVDHEVLADGGNGVTLQIDKEGDGMIDRTLHVGSTLSDIISPEVNITNVSSEYLLGETISPVITAVDESLPLSTLVYLNDLLVYDNQNILLTKVGTNKLKIVTRDNVGNETIKDITFYVHYNFSGFLQPINDIGYYLDQKLSVFKAGSTIPVKFQLKRSDGTLVQASSVPVWLSPQKGSSINALVDEVTASVSATSGNTYKWDIANQQYVYNWSTKGLNAGYWYRIYAELDDGKVYSVVVGLR